ncbi:hypothetical protein M407DRAFT_26607 [Tulasnella calospora MUT 4182]|uniref:DUF4219 domain-containing protein n=1 Tax=Tulasnella calospora MUT 4182 TaxID=1051891 RepID=A0A0C3LRG8_9AGAM|nr:hypothetical protein M407DRAFT_26607 [Tulasnella calospora MUT 4182]
MDSSKNFYQIPKLTNENYSEWSRLVKQVLKHQGLWGFVDEIKGIADASDDPGSSKPTEQAEWLGKFDKAFAVLALTLSVELTYITEDASLDKPKKLWDELKKRFEKPGAISSFSELLRLQNFTFQVHHNGFYNSDN